MDDNVFEVQIRGDQFGDAPFIVQAANERLLIEKKQAIFLAGGMLPFAEQNGSGGVERLHTAVGEQNGKVCLTGGGICLGDQYRPQKKGVTRMGWSPREERLHSKGPLDRQISCQPARRHIEKFGHGIHRPLAVRLQIPVFHEKLNFL